uniref:Ketosynthase family 3 (KS3) domain-containing protein n=1 Tax=Chromera velia CCMP2878 TaxID=1169474 RepID=A0A0G4GLE9_9ALVE|eukprot:Cvel_678.t1-p1 / transcript=Cvel_678.t1 / gene=Cvel_678 / organism=Chromera_velia_CCMP2878 / gene_product=Phthiocerol/phenolphthiocerol synthesis polyketide, putative / transcript_product=Phthiocerol/phenolphthiocerol synthesis polyketide, putative / location=Cvel_scaffold21:23732-35035(+) / protein_length=2469 / sequence_SO=supercontig / SO=protein_coding / is_pseudo=false
MEQETQEKVSLTSPPPELALRPDQISREDDLVLVSAACRLPRAASPEEFWRLLASPENGDQKREAVSCPPASRGWKNLSRSLNLYKDFSTKLAETEFGWIGDVESFDCGRFGLSVAETAALDPQQRWLLEVSHEALVGAGVARQEECGARVACVVGSSSRDFAVEMQTLLVSHSLRETAVKGERVSAQYSPSPVSSAFALTASNFALLANRVSYSLGLRGPSFVVDGSSASSLVALDSAVRMLRDPQSFSAPDAVVVGAVNAVFSPQVTLGLVLSGVHSPLASVTGGGGRCRSFDSAANGFVRGEACVAFVLRRLSSLTESEKARALAILRSVSVVHGRPAECPGGDWTQPRAIVSPSSEAHSKAIREAVRAAGLEPWEVAAVEAHGSGTPAGDIAEMSALRAAYLESVPRRSCPLIVGAGKSVTGHAEGAAGLVGLLKAVLSLRHGAVPPIRHLKEPKPKEEGGFGHDECVRLPSDSTGPLRLLPLLLRSSLEFQEGEGGDEQKHSRDAIFMGVSSLGLGCVNAHAIVCTVPRDWGKIMNEGGTKTGSGGGSMTTETETGNDDQSDKIAEKENKKRDQRPQAQANKKRLTFPLPWGSDVALPLPAHDWGRDRERETPTTTQRTSPGNSKRITPSSSAAQTPPTKTAMPLRTINGTAEATPKPKDEREKPQQHVRFPLSERELEGESRNLEEEAGEEEKRESCQTPKGSVGVREESLVLGSDGGGVGTLGSSSSSLSPRKRVGGDEVWQQMSASERLRGVTAVVDSSLREVLPALSLSASPEGVEMDAEIRGESGEGDGVAHVDRVSHSQSFQELGLDSAGSVEFVGLLELRLYGSRRDVGGRLPRTLPFDFPSVSALSAHLASELAGDSAKSCALLPTVDPALLRAELENPRVCIVGMACRAPRSVRSPRDLWWCVIEKEDAVSEWPLVRGMVDDLFNPEYSKNEHGTYVRRGGFMEDVELFDAPFFDMKPQEAAATDVQQRCMLEVAFEALHDAGYSKESIRGSNCGVYLGAASPEWQHVDKEMQHIKRQSPFIMQGNLLSIVSNRVSYALGLKGPSFSIDTACSSSLVAFDIAVKGLTFKAPQPQKRAKNGRREDVQPEDAESLPEGAFDVTPCDMAITGGVQINLTPSVLAYLCKARFLSPNGRCRPFDAKADGYCRSEGCGAVLLKKAAAVQRDRDSVYATVRGTALTHVARTMVLTAPGSESQARCIATALQDGRVRPERVSYFESHGTGTSLGDPIEIDGIRKVFGSDSSEAAFAAPLVIGALKGNIGHSEGASGILGLIRCVLSLMQGVAAPILHLRNLNPHLGLDRFGKRRVVLPSTESGALELRAQREEKESAGVGDEEEEGNGLIGCVSAYGFGGANAHAVVQAASGPLARGRLPAEDSGSRDPQGEGERRVYPFPWKHKRFPWIPIAHPMTGARRPHEYFGGLRGTFEGVYESLLREDTASVYSDHKVMGNPLVPGMGYLDIIGGAAVDSLLREERTLVNPPTGNLPASVWDFSCEDLGCPLGWDVGIVFEQVGFIRPFRLPRKVNPNQPWVVSVGLQREEEEEEAEEGDESDAEQGEEEDEKDAGKQEEKGEEKKKQETEGADGAGEKKLGLAKPSGRHFVVSVKNPIEETPERVCEGNARAFIAPLTQSSHSLSSQRAGSDSSNKFSSLFEELDFEILGDRPESLEPGDTQERNTNSKTAGPDKFGSLENVKQRCLFHLTPQERLEKLGDRSIEENAPVWAASRFESDSWYTSVMPPNLALSDRFRVMKDFAVNPEFGPAPSPSEIRPLSGDHGEDPTGGWREEAEGRPVEDKRVLEAVGLIGLEGASDTERGFWGHPGLLDGFLQVGAPLAIQALRLYFSDPASSSPAGKREGDVNVEAMSPVLRALIHTQIYVPVFVEKAALRHIPAVTVTSNGTRVPKQYLVHYSLRVPSKQRGWRQEVLPPPLHANIRVFDASDNKLVGCFLRVRLQAFDSPAAEVPRQLLWTSMWQQRPASGPPQTPNGDGKQEQEALVSDSKRDAQPADVKAEIEKPTQEKSRDGAGRGEAPPHADGFLVLSLTGGELPRALASRAGPESEVHVLSEADERRKEKDEEGDGEAALVQALVEGENRKKTNLAELQQKVKESLTPLARLMTSRKWRCVVYTGALEMPAADSAVSVLNGARRIAAAFLHVRMPEWLHVRILTVGVHSAMPLAPPLEGHTDLPKPGEEGKKVKAIKEAGGAPRRNQQPNDSVEYEGNGDEEKTRSTVSGPKKEKSSLPVPSNPAFPVHGGLWGFARCFRTEMEVTFLRLPSFGCVDLDPDSANMRGLTVGDSLSSRPVGCDADRREKDMTGLGANVVACAEEVCSVINSLRERREGENEEEVEVAVRDGKHFTLRLVQQDGETRVRGPVELSLSSRGALRNLQLRAQTLPRLWRWRQVLPGSPAPTDGSGLSYPGSVGVRVRAVGLNFRDVLNVMGLYPGAAGQLTDARLERD